MGPWKGPRGTELPGRAAPVGWQGAPFFVLILDCVLPAPSSPLCPVLAPAQLRSPQLGAPLAGVPTPQELRPDLLPTPAGLLHLSILTRGIPLNLLF